ncbi:putative deacetylase LmbE-like domain-containing protein [Polychytrium aggregatum]|uniref:putative deacetylase LmbE-like domain-containing protein n=1 Tax=Polychytrium aggregatum TaxID=110093 RepID=UPI0022FE1A92|nr:putative deacetylase LmbE-like domain-containing protein [Polychytrium aggregatum]KAI9202010.1 putative deacetylase LmbE-like domain-containing protein [Polychytrium aggregatum]
MISVSSAILLFVILPALSLYGYLVMLPSPPLFASVCSPSDPHSLAHQRSSTSPNEPRASQQSNGYASASPYPRVLVVVAHPDDECMFFGPTITALTSSNADKVFLLCLSSGNYDGLGSIRKKELVDSASELGISPSHVTVLEDSRIQDHPHDMWDADIVAEAIRLQVSHHNIDVIVTFDQFGITNHPNHRSAFHGVRKLIRSGAVPDPTSDQAQATTASSVLAFSLDSISLARKYTSVLDLIPTTLLAWLRSQPQISTDEGPNSRYSGQPLVVVAPPWHVQKGFRAMFRHRSQLVWFRYLYLASSRYMLINELHQIK